jgi:hypothetical protein
MINTPLDRRQAMAALLAGAAVPAISQAAAPPAASTLTYAGMRPAPGTRWTSSFLDLDPVQRFRQAMRIQRNLVDDADVLHWYHFIMFAVPVGMAPRPVVRWEGIEFSHHRHLGNDRYRMHGHNLSFPRDLHSGAFVDEVLNPVTGNKVKVPPMALTGDPGLIRSPEGTITLDNPAAAPRPEYKLLRRESGLVKVDAIRVPPESWPVTFVEMGYEATPAQLFDDPKLTWLPSEVSGAYVFPWPAWMGMDKAPGHMFAAWSGYKLRSIDELPLEFLQRAERDCPQLLKVDMSPFSKPIPGITR